MSRNSASMRATTVSLVRSFLWSVCKWFLDGRSTTGVPLGRLLLATILYQHEGGSPIRDPDLHPETLGNLVRLLQGLVTSPQDHLGGTWLGVEHKGQLAV